MSVYSRHEIIGLPIGFNGYPLTQGQNSTQLNTLNERMALLMRAPAPHLIDAIGVKIQSVTGTPGTAKIGIQGLTAGSRYPDGTWKNDGGGEASVSSSSFSVGVNWYTLDNDYQVTMGERLALVFEANSGTWDGSNQVTVLYKATPSNINNYGTGPPMSALYFSASWSSSLGVPIMAYRVGSKTYGVLPTANSSSNLSNTTNPDEIGYKITPDFNVKVVGMAMSQQGTDTAWFNMRVYDSDDVQLASKLFDGRPTTASRRLHFFLLDDPVLLEAGKTYRTTMFPNTATSTSIGYSDYASQQDMEAMLPPNWQPTERQDGGAWTDATTRIRDGMMPLLEFVDPQANAHTLVI